MKKNSFFLTIICKLGPKWTLNTFTALENDSKKVSVKAKANGQFSAVTVAKLSTKAKVNKHTDITQYIFQNKDNNISILIT